MAAARKTAAQRRQLEEAAASASRQLEWDEFLKSYPTRFAAVLYFYASDSNGFEVSKVDAETYVFKHEDRMWRQFVHLKVTAPVNYDRDYTERLEEVERVMNDYLAELAEEQRRYEVRQAALAKARSVLNEEERKLLNL